MNRAEMRRQQKQQAKINTVLKKAGVPEFRPPVAQMRITGLSDQELANMTGVKIAALEEWRKEQTEMITRAAIKEAQERLDRAEFFLTFCNIMTSIKAMDGFRYAKAAVKHFMENYNKSIVSSEPEHYKETYEELHEKYGVEFEFDDPKINEELGFGDIDWMKDYIGMNIPYSVYQKIYDDSKNIQSVYTQLAVIWELCEEFGFHKYPDSKGNKLKKFMFGTKEKYDRMELMEHGARDISKMLKEKYDIEIGWSEGVQETIERFDL
ncbi:MAG: hypothetical protein IJ274_00075 [Lachnospiraceae bacterium]|nr:hypothetical protein [Lachnospiraceae bacterium]